MKNKDAKKGLKTILAFMVVFSLLSGLASANWLQDIRKTEDDINLVSFLSAVISPGTQPVYRVCGLDRDTWGVSKCNPCREDEFIGACYDIEAPGVGCSYSGFYTCGRECSCYSLDIVPEESRDDVLFLLAGPDPGGYVEGGTKSCYTSTKFYGIKLPREVLGGTTACTGPPGDRQIMICNGHTGEWMYERSCSNECEDYSLFETTTLKWMARCITPTGQPEIDTTTSDDPVCVGQTGIVCKDGVVRHCFRNRHNKLQVDTRKTVICQYSCNLRGECIGWVAPGTNAGTGRFHTGDLSGHELSFQKDRVHMGEDIVVETYFLVETPGDFLFTLDLERYSLTLSAVIGEISTTRNICDPQSDPSFISEKVTITNPGLYKLIFTVKPPGVGRYYAVATVQIDPTLCDGHLPHSGSQAVERVFAYTVLVDEKPTTTTPTPTTTTPTNTTTLPQIVDDKDIDVDEVCTDECDFTGTKCDEKTPNVMLSCSKGESGCLEIITHECKTGEICEAGSCETKNPPPTTTTTTLSQLTWTECVAKGGVWLDGRCVFEVDEEECRQLGGKMVGGQCQIHGGGGGGETFLQRMIETLYGNRLLAVLLLVAFVAVVCLGIYYIYKEGG